MVVPRKGFCQTRKTRKKFLFKISPVHNNQDYRKEERQHQSVLSLLRFQFTQKGNWVCACVSISKAVSNTMCVYVYQNVQKGGLVLAAMSTVTVMEQYVILLRDAVTVQLA